MKKIALLTLLLINLSLSFSLPRNQASPAIFSVTKTNNSILFRHTDSTLTAIPCQSVASIVSNADPSKIVSVWVVQQGDYDKIMQFDYSVCGFSSKSDAVDSLTAWAICDTSSGGGGGVGDVSQSALDDSILTLRSIRKVDTSYIFRNATLDSTCMITVINGITYRSCAKDSVGSGTAYTFSTGLTNTSSTITNNLSTGVSGGQSVIGGTASGENLTLSSTSNATKGNIIFGTSAYDEVNNRLGIGTTTPTAKLDVRSASGGSNSGINLTQVANGANNISYVPIDFSVPTTGLVGQFLATASNYYEATVNLAANSIALFNYGNGTSGQLGLGAAASNGYITFNAGGYGTSTERMRITSNGNVGIGTTSPVASAKLQISSTTSGFLPPVMTSTQASAISSPAQGLMLFVTDTNGTFTSVGWWGYNGATWEKLNN